MAIRLNVHDGTYLYHKIHKGTFVVLNVKDGIYYIKSPTHGEILSVNEKELIHFFDIIGEDKEPIPIGFESVIYKEDIGEKMCQVYKEELLEAIDEEEAVKNPSHYTNGGIEPMDFIFSNGMNFLEGNIVKYITRYKFKNGLQDLKKARVYLDRLINEYEHNERV